MNELLKRQKLYVLGTVNDEGVRMYLYKKPQKIEYTITPNISQANKFTALSTANMFLDFYYGDMGTDIQFVPVPVEVQYNLIVE